MLNIRQGRAEVAGPATVTPIAPTPAPGHWRSAKSAARIWIDYGHRDRATDRPGRHRCLQHGRGYKCRRDRRARRLDLGPGHKSCDDPSNSAGSPVVLRYGCSSHYGKGIPHRLICGAGQRCQCHTDRGNHYRVDRWYRHGRRVQSAGRDRSCRRRPAGNPFTCQVSALFALLVTVADNCAVDPSLTWPAPLHGDHRRWIDGVGTRAAAATGQPCKRPQACNSEQPVPKMGTRPLPIDTSNHATLRQGSTTTNR